MIVSNAKPFCTYGNGYAIVSMYPRNVGKHETTMWSYTESLDSRKSINVTYYYSTLF